MCKEAWHFIMITFSHGGLTQEQHFHSTMSQSLKKKTLALEARLFLKKLLGNVKTLGKTDLTFFLTTFCRSCMHGTYNATVLRNGFPFNVGS